MTRSSQNLKILLLYHSLRSLDDFQVFICGTTSKNKTKFEAFRLFLYNKIYKVWCAAVDAEKLYQLMLYITFF